MNDDRSYGWLWVVIAGVLLAVAAAGVNTLSHGGLTSVGVLTFTSDSFRFLGAAFGVMAFVVVVGGTLWLINPTLAAMNRTRARLTVLGLLLVGGALVAFTLLRGGKHPGVAPSASPHGWMPGNAHARESLHPKGTEMAWNGPLLLIAALLIVLLAAGFLFYQQLVRRRKEIAPVSPAVPPLAMAARAGRDAVLAGDMSPRAAIIRCFAAMETELSGHPDASPRASDTPSEVLRRGWQAGLIRPGPANKLLNLFATARFSDHPMTEQYRTNAADALSEMLDDLQEHAR